MILDIKHLMEERGYTGKELAAKIGLSEVSMSKIVKGESLPRYNVLLQLSKELDVDIRELFHPTKGGELLNGFVQYKDKVYTINSAADLDRLVKEVKSSNEL